MKTRRLGTLDVSELGAGCMSISANYGPAAGRDQGIEVIRTAHDRGVTFFDTAEVYGPFTSEALVGEALAPIRDEVVIATKFGFDMDAGGTLNSRPAHIRKVVEGSLKRLRTDRIDLYLSHRPDAGTPIEETLGAYDALISAGKVRAVGGSNSTAAGLREALDAAGSKKLPRYEVEQPEYNLYERGKFEGPLRDLCVAQGVGVIVYYSLASGFLSGKYRSKADLKGSARAGGVENYLNERGLRILGALDAVARAHGAKPAEVALAWLIAREGVTAPIASATNADQVDSLVRATQLELSAQEIAALTAASD
jgi:aryl-alcohol dehydrogenase-like predicted oxidoreductase